MAETYDMKSLLATLLIGVALLTGCTSTGVVPVGGDMYMISRNGTAISAGSNLKAQLYKEANAWCAARGLVMVPVGEAATDGLAGVRLGSAEIRFRAVKPNTAARVDAKGATAEDYDALARKYDAQGETELANLARQRAAALR